MSTRCQILFASDTDDTAPARIYRHCDGYPNGEHGVPADLARFFRDVKAGTKDTRFGDAEYLAAKFVVWQAAKNARGGNPLDFISLGVASSLHGDEVYEYRVLCDTDYRDPDAVPGVQWRRVGGKWRKALCDGTDGED